VERGVKVCLGALWVRVTGRSALLVKQLVVMVMEDVLRVKVLGGFSSDLYIDLNSFYTA